MFMPNTRKLTPIFILTLLAATLLASTGTVHAKPPVHINFSTNGLNNIDGDTVILTINGTQYQYSGFPTRAFTWTPGDKYNITATKSITAWDYNIYNFSSWSDEVGLTDASRIYTVPSADTTITLNYAKTTFHVTFTTSGLNNVDGDVLTIDGVTYKYGDLNSFNSDYQSDTHKSLWIAGSTHSIEAITPVMSYDTPNKGYKFVSWTNGNGLTDASGTFTMPNSNVDVIANYVQSTVHISFAHSGLSNINAGVTVLNIDGVNYDYWQVQQTNFQWPIGSTHTITAATSITGWDSVTHWFSGWTNGDGLTGASGTYTVPDHDTAITANYGLTQPPTDTALTISCTPQSVNSAGTQTTTITGTLTNSGTGIAGKTVSLSYFDGVAWNPIGTATTAADGTYLYTWDIPDTLPNGQYAVKAEFAGDGNYAASSATTGCSGNGGNLFVLPEYLWGGLAALFACFGALALFKWRAHKKTLTRMPTAGFPA
jgi:hypothetical protein